ncbi:cell adhesion protein byn-1 [Epithele typhae]|uniref:cell adhesion protein byn-1 n=1 Tax=Epithele typhae TaxID=378194 RepID=UPI002007D755|nr:cell adhesion protein byn-1 [Epithele typhae]KAH9943001.1 cell adhesion protein byn-1 [Epithele typhae]
MPKAPKAPAKPKHDPLHVQLGEDEVHAKYGRVSQPGRRRKSRAKDDEEEAGEAILDPKTSRRIFELARDQQDEFDDKELDDEDEDEDEAQRRFTAPRGPSFEDEDDLDLDQFENDDEEEIDEIEVDEDDMRALDAMLPPNIGDRRTLADIIFSKLENLEAGSPDVARDKAADPNRAPDPAAGLDPKVVEVYSKVGQMLTRYKSGPLPKPFKIIPSLPQWARILSLTHPENWSPQALVLLDAIREDIRLTREGARKNKNHRKLNVHFYESLKRSMYKPGAVFKGIVFPLLSTGCTLQEAAIVASVLAKVKIPLGHSAAALMRLANMDYSGANSLFIRVLLDKKHALPYKVVDALIFHFIRLSNTYKARKAGDAEKLPVLWHQSLLVFCQRYAADLTPDQKDALLDVIRVNPHPQISAEVRRELVNSVERGAPRPDADGDVSMA